MLARCLAVVFACLLSVVVQAAEVVGVRIWDSPDSTRVVLDLTGPVNYKAFALNGGPLNRIVVDLERSSMTMAPEDIANQDTRVTRIRSGRREADGLRVVFETQQPMAVKSFQLLPEKTPYHRIVLDLMLQESEQQAIPVRSAQESARPSSQPRDIIIAIDAGHGGEDPGAIGPNRLMEKHAVLAIAKELERLVRQEPGFTPFMIRTGDYYISLRDRTRKATEAKADFLISIHADAFKHPSARGGSVFVLSERGASSESAKFLADRENESDIMGGVLASRENYLVQTLMDMQMTHYRKESRMLGADVLGRMGQVARLHKSEVEEAGFMVLRTPSMPAILVETGFISNPEEARKLATERYQKNMARSLFEGIRNYFQAHPTEGSLLASLKQQSLSQQTHIIRRGDNLSTIAQRYGVSVGQIKQANNLTSDRLHVGQELKIPQS
ncbi:MAG: N-acetylmuramoyl-L-alanine amidase [Bacterioplanes sp.]|nr:N-acetylmuramoyl-L-alanine amidase [Bacterioplanes sp.]